MNDLQKQAAESPNGYVQIVAGPGTGKTVTLVSRIVELLNRGLNPQKVCVLSFTRAAARELKTKVALETGKECPIVIGTFHSIAYRFLRRFGGEKYKKLSIIDDTEKKEILKQFADDSTEVKYLMHAISRVQVFGEQQDAETQRIYEQYKELTDSINRVDYDGLLCLFLDFLTSSTSVQDSLDAVLVDEFQDTSQVQLKIAVALASKCHNLTVVGDPDQSIYSFRNAEPRVFDLMNKLAPQEVIHLYLESNYRSTQPILDAAHRVVSSSRRLKAETSSEKMPVKFMACGSPNMEGKLVADHVSLLLESGVKPDEICILSRKSATYRFLESEFMVRGISVRTVGGKRTLMTREVRAIIDYIRVAIDHEDKLAISRTLNFPARKIGPTSVQKVSNGPGGFPSMDLIRQNASQPGFNTYVKLVNELSTVLGTTQDLEKVLDAIEFCQVNLFPNTETQELRETARQFAEMLEEDLDPEVDDRSFAEQFVSLWALGSNQVENDTNESRVTLSTIHSAKGLEWPVVFLIGAGPEQYNNSNNNNNTPTAESTFETDENRLLYVALTRAKFHLIVTSPRDQLDSRLNLDKTTDTFIDGIDKFLDAKGLSTCLKRPIEPPKPKPKSKPEPTRLGQPIELAEGFVLASDLPSIEPPKPKIERVSKENRKNSHPKQTPSKPAAKKQNGLLAYFQKSSKK